jgi:RNA polymerase sigma factor (sigma-70 family)
MRDDPSVVDLVDRARAGDKRAWDELVYRYSGMMWRVCRQAGLNEADAHDVGQNVWLKLYRELDKLREPAAVGGWLRTSTRNECSRFRLRRDRERPDSLTVEDNLPPNDDPLDAELLIEEQRLALRVAFGRISVKCQEALTLLMQVPPLTYAEIGERLGVSVGALGPRRGRCLDRIRADPAVAALIDTPTITEGGGQRVRPMVGK